MNKKLYTIGKSVERIDAPDKALGKAMFVNDMKFHNMLYGKVVISSYPNAKLLNIDIKEAKKIKGVKAILTYKDILGENQVGCVFTDQPLLVSESIRFIGDAIALIAAETPELCEEAASKINIIVEELDGVFSIAESRQKDATLVHKDKEDNIACKYQIYKGDIEKEFENADIIIEEEFYVAHQEHCYLEPQGTIVIPESNGNFIIYASMQCPFYVQKAVARVLGVPFNRIRVIQTITGGGFGGKEDIPNEMCSRAALLANATGCPVKLILTREEDFILTSKRHPIYMKYKVGATKDGKLISLKSELYSDCGAYASLSPIVLFRATVHAPGPYIIPNVQVNTYGMYTNHPPTGAFRGFGTPQVNFAIESIIDILAEQLNIDPLEIRLKNGLRKGTYTATNQLLDDSVGFIETLEKAKEISNWDILRKKYLIENKNKKKKLGIGISAMYYGMTLGAMGWFLDAAGALMQVYQDASVILFIGGIDMGQGAETVLTQIAAESLGINMKRIRIQRPDTAIVPDSGPTVASRTTVTSGNAIVIAANKLKNQLLTFVAEQLQVPFEELELEDEKVLHNGQEKMTFTDLIQKAYMNNINLEAEGWSVLPEVKWDLETGIGDAYYVYCYGAHIAIVEVDTETGIVSVLKVIASHDIGKAINPEQVKAQIQGGVVQGMGYALYENFVMEQGKILTGDFASYSIPTVIERPEIIPIIIEDPSKDGPYGAKGIGEPAIIPTAAAIANAIANAIGKHTNKLPILPEDLYEE